VNKKRSMFRRTFLFAWSVLPNARDITNTPSTDHVSFETQILRLDDLYQQALINKAKKSSIHALTLKCHALLSVSVMPYTMTLSPQQLDSSLRALGTFSALDHGEFPTLFVEWIAAKWGYWTQDERIFFMKLANETIAARPQSECFHTRVVRKVGATLVDTVERCHVPSEITTVCCFIAPAVRAPDEQFTKEQQQDVAKALKEAINRVFGKSKEKQSEVISSERAATFTNLVKCVAGTSRALEPTSVPEWVMLKEACDGHIEDLTRVARLADVAPYFRALTHKSTEAIDRELRTTLMKHLAAALERGLAVATQSLLDVLGAVEVSKDLFAQSGMTEEKVLYLREQFVQKVRLLSVNDSLHVLLACSTNPWLLAKCGPEAARILEGATIDHFTSNEILHLACEALPLLSLYDRAFQNIVTHLGNRSDALSNTDAVRLLASGGKRILNEEITKELIFKTTAEATELSPDDAVSTLTVSGVKRDASKVQRLSKHITSPLTRSTFVTTLGAFTTLAETRPREGSHMVALTHISNRLISLKQEMSPETITSLIRVLQKNDLRDDKLLTAVIIRSLNISMGPVQALDMLEAITKMGIRHIGLVESLSRQCRPNDLPRVIECLTVLGIMQSQSVVKVVQDNIHMYAAELREDCSADTLNTWSICVMRLLRQSPKVKQDTQAVLLPKLHIAAKGFESLSIAGLLALTVSTLMVDLDTTTKKRCLHTTLNRLQNMLGFHMGPASNDFSAPPVPAKKASSPLQPSLPKELLDIDSIDVFEIIMTLSLSKTHKEECDAIMFNLSSRACEAMPQCPVPVVVSMAEAYANRKLLASNIFATTGRLLIKRQKELDISSACTALNAFALMGIRDDRLLLVIKKYLTDTVADGKRVSGQNLVKYNFAKKVFLL